MPPTGQYNVFELSTGSVVGISTTATVTMSTTSVVGLTTTSVVGLTTATAPLLVPAAVATIASVIATTSFGLLQAANTGRKGLIVYSCVGSANPALVAYTTAVSATNFSLAMNPGSYWEMPPTISTVGMSIGCATAASTGAVATVVVTELT